MLCLLIHKLYVWNILIKNFFICFCRCSPRFLRKTRETLQREHREKQLLQQKHRQEDEEQLRQFDDALYEAASAQEIRVRPGEPRKRQQQTTKISVAIDATPATRTDSILNQVPIELKKFSNEYLHCFLEDSATGLGASEYCEPSEFHEVNIKIITK